MRPWDGASAAGGSVSDSLRAAMLAAIGAAREGVESGEQPYGAVVMSADGGVIACAHDEVTARADPTAHSELLAVQGAVRALGPDLRGCTLVCTVEPCAMCFQAAWWAAIDALVFGIEMREIAERYPEAIEEVVIDSESLNTLATRRLALTGGVLRSECLELWVSCAS